MIWHLSYATELSILKAPVTSSKLPLEMIGNGVLTDWNYITGYFSFKQNNLFI